MWYRRDSEEACETRILVETRLRGPFEHRLFRQRDSERRGVMREFQLMILPSRLSSEKGKGERCRKQGNGQVGQGDK